MTTIFFSFRRAHRGKKVENWGAAPDPAPGGGPFFNWGAAPDPAPGGGPFQVVQVPLFLLLCEPKKMMRRIGVRGGEGAATV